MPWTYGIHAVETLIDESPEQVQEVWLVRGERAGAARKRVAERVETSGIRMRWVSDQQLRGAVGDVAHQGVAARVLDHEYADEEALLREEGPGLIVVLDEVQDPQNLGSLLRTACAMGARGVVIPKHRAAGVTPTVMKVAAGALATLPVARVTNLVRWVEQAKEAGYWIYGTVVDEGEAPWTVDLSERAVLVLGSEQRGVRPGLLSACDVRLCVPMEGLESLNVGVAGGIFVYEWRRQRSVRAGGKEKA